MRKKQEQKTKRRKQTQGRSNRFKPIIYLQLLKVCLSKKLEDYETSLKMFALII